VPDLVPDPPPPRRPSDRGESARSEEPLPAALVYGTSREYLGRRALPRALRERPLVVIAGPAGVGKTTVALQVAGEGAVRLEGSALHKATVDRIRRRKWPDALLGPEPLVLDGPVWLGQRPAAAAALQELVRQRVDLGHRTFLCEGAVRDGSMGILMDAVAPEQRATVMLRFPAGNGRARFARRACAEMGLPPHFAQGLERLDPWSYTSVRTALDALRRPEPR
jgi:hypothetical protein